MTTPGFDFAHRPTFSSLVLLLTAALFVSACEYRANVVGTSLSAVPVLGDVSGNGRYVLFATATSLVPADTNFTSDLYRKDTQSGALEVVAPGSDGATVFGEISDDGRWVVFESRGTNLVVGDTNGEKDVFVRDMNSAAITRVNEFPGGAEPSSADKPAISADGAFVTFRTEDALLAADNDSTLDVYRYEVGTGALDLVSPGLPGTVSTGIVQNSSLNFDGSLVAFGSNQSNLVLADTNGDYDVFVWFAATGAVVRASVDGAGNQVQGDSLEPSMSGNGVAVAFRSASDDFLAGDTNGTDDVYVKLITGPVFRASVDNGGQGGIGNSYAPRMNHDGALVTFISEVPELSGEPAGGAVLRDGLNGTTTTLSLDVDGIPQVSLFAAMAGGGLYTVHVDGLEVINQWWSNATVSSITPSSVSLGATQPVTITGSGFNTRALHTVYTHINNADGISFSNIVVVDDETITADITTTVGVTTTGPKTLWVQAFGTGPGPFAGSLENCECLEVTL